MDRKINTVYAESSTPLWSYYFKLENLSFYPSLWIGSENQRPLSHSLSIPFISKIDINNLDLSFEYKLSEDDNKFLETLYKNEILYRMYFRHSFDEIPDKALCNEITTKYLQVWGFLIEKFSLQAMILLEMPHLPYSYVGYLYFEHQNKNILFSSSLPIKGISFFSDKIENYPIFERYESDYMLNEQVNSKEQDFYLSELKNKYGIKVPKENIAKDSLIKMLIIYLRNFIFPKLTNRLKYKYISKGKYKMIDDRKFHLEVIKRTIKRFLYKKYYKSIVEDKINTDKLKILFALHYEPELAVYPLAGKNNNQFEIIKRFSKELSDSAIIYVKEYPLIFSYGRPFGLFRGKKFYRELLELGNVKFLDFHQKTSKFIPDVDLVLALTGTIGWEAFLEGKPVIYFGYSWYGGLPSMQKYHVQLDIKSFIASSKKTRTKIDYNRIYDILSAKVFDVDVKYYYHDEKTYELKALILKELLQSKFSEIEQNT